jgi:hypothetical protein
VFVKQVCDGLTIKTGLMENDQNNYAVITRNQNG